MCADAGDGKLDKGRLRLELADHLENGDPDLEEEVSDLLDAESDVDIEFDSSNSSYTYTKRAILEAMGDWDDVVSNNIDSLTDDVMNDIICSIRSVPLDADSLEEGLSIDTRVGCVRIRLLAVNEDGDPIEEDD